jgi:hypothetical protein
VGPRGPLVPGAESRALQDRLAGPGDRHERPGRVLGWRLLALHGTGRAGEADWYVDAVGAGAGRRGGAAVAGAVG